MYNVYVRYASRSTNAVIIIIIINIILNTLDGRIGTKKRTLSVYGKLVATCIISLPANRLPCSRRDASTYAVGLCLMVCLAW